MKELKLLILLLFLIFSKKMVKAFDKVWKISQEKKVTLRTAAYILALQRLSTKSLRNP